MECVTCHEAAIEGLLCGGCGAIQPPLSGLDKFAVLGVARTFDLDMTDLERRYRELSRRVHPDRFARAPAEERRRSLSAATTLNEAYRTLRAAVPRAEYLLELAGKAACELPMDPEFLAEMLELREEQATLRAAGDTARLRALAANVRARLDEALARIAGLFAAHARGGAPDLLERVYVELASGRYFQRFLDDNEGEG
mgnify:CR=1 FL=1